MSKRKELASSVLIDMASKDAEVHFGEGFSAPEAVGPRRSSWSDGDYSTLFFGLDVDTKPYVLSFLAEPYAGALPVGLRIMMNGKHVAEKSIQPGWRAYSVRVDGGMVDGENELRLLYSKTARPADVEPDSSDLRQLSVRFDQFQVQPISDRVQLTFNVHNAAARAAMGEGWALDPADRAAGVWTVGGRSELTLYLAPTTNPSYEILLTAYAVRGLAAQPVQVSLNGTTLGTITFGPKRSTERVQVAASALRDENQLNLSCASPTAPATLDPKSKDTRLLGIRAVKLEILPATGAPAPG